MDRYGLEGDNLARTKRGKYVLWDDVRKVLTEVLLLSQAGINDGANLQREIRDVAKEELGE